MAGERDPQDPPAPGSIEEHRQFAADLKRQQRPDDEIRAALIARGLPPESADLLVLTTTHLDSPPPPPPPHPVRWPSGKESPEVALLTGVLMLGLGLVALLTSYNEMLQSSTGRCVITSSLISGMTLTLRGLIRLMDRSRQQ
ncbi:MAG: hypothetical protein JW910_00315 [Anaerolineae bacterium]|nr:hypothetical protein [Anaerolineae bacterium]